MADLTQFDLLNWLVQKDKPLSDRVTNLLSNVRKGTGQLLADTRHERRIIACLADLVRASGLAKHTPGTVGRVRQAPEEVALPGTVPVTDLSQVMPEEDEAALVAARAERVVAERAAAPTPPVPPAMAQIQEAGRAKLEQQRARAAAMREKLAEKRAQQAAGA